MLNSKFWAITGLCWLLSLPFAFGQNPSKKALAPTIITKKWDFGLRAGAGFNSSHLRTRTINGARYIEQPFLPSDSGPQYYFGGFARRNLSKRWSLQSELSLLLNPYKNSGVSLGLFSRYHLTHWLSLEAGVEARQMLTGNAPKISGLWVGPVLHWKNLEINMRYSPGYKPGYNVFKGQVNHGFQIGISTKLGSH